MNEQDKRDRVINKRVGRNVFDSPPKVSVIIPAYNVAEFIGETLESVIGQKFREHEVIVVNDGSPDTEQFERAIRSYREEIIYIKQRNLGAAVARNTAIEHARGDVVAFLDGDDIWLPVFLASQYVFLQRHSYDMVYCNATLFGMHSAYRRTFMEDAPSEGVADFDSLIDLRCNVITSGTLARKDVVVAAGMFGCDKDRPRAHDFQLWLRMALNGAKIGYQKKVLLKYRVHSASLSGDSISRAEREIEAFKTVRRKFELSDDQVRRVDQRIRNLEANLAVEQGKAFLLSGDYIEAAVAFRVANRQRRSMKLGAIAMLARFAPETLLKIFKKRRSADIPLVARFD